MKTVTPASFHATYGNTWKMLFGVIRLQFSAIFTVLRHANQTGLTNSMCDGAVGRWLTNHAGLFDVNWVYFYRGDKLVNASIEDSDSCCKTLQQLFNTDQFAVEMAVQGLVNRPPLEWHLH